MRWYSNEEMTGGTWSIGCRDWGWAAGEIEVDGDEEGLRRSTGDKALGSTQRDGTKLQGGSIALEGDERAGAARLSICIQTFLFSQAQRLTSFPKRLLFLNLDPVGIT